MAKRIARRKFIVALSGATVAWPLGARAQQSVLPVVALVNGGSAGGSARYAVAFGKGLSETGYVEGQNVTVEYHWLEGHYDRVPALVSIWSAEKWP
jgi:putative ABC transport system substrate-binding protein